MPDRKIQPTANLSIGARLRRAMVRAGLNQKLVAQRAGLDEGTVSAVMRGGVKPNWATVERLGGAIGTTWGERFEEAQMPLSTPDAALANDLKDLLDRLLRSDARQKERRRSRSAKPHGGAAFDDVVPLPNARIPEIYVRAGARRANTGCGRGLYPRGCRGGVVPLRPPARRHRRGERQDRHRPAEQDAVPQAHRAAGTADGVEEGKSALRRYPRRKRRSGRAAGDCCRFV